MGFFASFWSWLNGQLATYVGDNTARLAAVLEPAVVSLRDHLRDDLGLSASDWKN